MPQTEWRTVKACCGEVITPHACPQIQGHGDPTQDAGLKVLDEISALHSPACSPLPDAASTSHGAQDQMASPAAPICNQERQ